MVDLLGEWRAASKIYAAVILVNLSSSLAQWAGAVQLLSGLIIVFVISAHLFLALVAPELLDPRLMGEETVKIKPHFFLAASSFSIIFLGSVGLFVGLIGQIETGFVRVFTSSVLLVILYAKKDVVDSSTEGVISWLNDYFYSNWKEGEGYGRPQYYMIGLIAALVIATVLSPQESQEELTSLYILGEDGGLDGLFSNYSLGEEITVIAGLEHQGESGSFELIGYIHKFEGENRSVLIENISLDRVEVEYVSDIGFQEHRFNYTTVETGFFTIYVELHDTENDVLVRDVFHRFVISS